MKDRKIAAPRRKSMIAQSLASQTAGKVRNRAAPARALGVLLAVALCCACGQQVSQLAPAVQLADCEPGEGPSNARCGWIPVYEDREAGTGRQIDLRVVVFPAVGNDVQPDPVFVLLGGPGQGAAQASGTVIGLFGRLRQERDIVFVDQRGTGKSNGLPCDPDTDDLASLFSVEEGVAGILECLQEYEGDLSLYTTPIAMDDLDEVRSALGYESINLWGGSYGTRAAQVYVRRHGDTVRSVVFDGAVPMAMKLPEGFPQDSQRALDRLFDDCEQDATCRERFGDLRGMLARVVARLGRQGTVSVRHPSTGVETEVELLGDQVMGALRMALYSADAAAMVPLLIEQMHGGDFGGTIALAYGAGGMPAAAKIHWGMFFSVVCAEDLPWVDESARDAEPFGLFSNEQAFETWDRVCDAWPRGEIAGDYHERVISDVPALVLSGDLDPVTPPSRGEELAAGFSNVRHVVVPGIGHGATAPGCLPGLVADFIKAGSPEELDFACADELARPGFFVSLSGPEMEATQ